MAGAAMASRSAEIKIRPVQSAIWSVEAWSEFFRSFFICLDGLSREERDASFMIEATSRQWQAFHTLNFTPKHYLKKKVPNKTRDGRMDIASEMRRAIHP